MSKYDVCVHWNFQAENFDIVFLCLLFWTRESLVETGCSVSQPVVPGDLWVGRQNFLNFFKILIAHRHFIKFAKSKPPNKLILSQLNKDLIDA